MKILFIGDNLVKGTIGVNWVKWLASKNPGWQVENAGVNGDTLAQVKERLDQKLEQYRFDLIFFEAGLNDLLTPELSAKGLLFRHKYGKKVNNVYSRPEDFESAYRAAIESIKSRSNGEVIVSTLGCMSENLETGLNRKRCTYNSIIREIAIDSGCGLVDAGALFDGYLRRCRTRDYLMEGFLNAACLDRFQCSVMGCPDYLSKKRGLHLTIDGVHLNSRGANLFRDETERHIKSLTSLLYTGAKERRSSIDAY